MPEKVTKEEKLIEVAIMKAKEILQNFQDGTTVRLDEDVMGEDIKLKRPKKNPSEEKIKNPTGDEGYGYVGKTEMIVKAVNMVFDAFAKYDYTGEDELRDTVAMLNEEFSELTTKLVNKVISEQTFNAEARRITNRLIELRDVSGLSGHAQN